MARLKLATLSFEFTALVILLQIKQRERGREEHNQQSRTRATHSGAVVFRSITGAESDFPAFGRFSDLRVINYCTLLQIIAT